MKTLAKISLFSLLVFSSPAFGADSQIPDMATLFNNILMLPNYILTLLRWGMITIAIFGFVYGVFLVWYSGRMAMGNPPKFISIRDIPSTGNVLFIMLVSACLYAFADGFFVMSQMVKGVTGATMASPYSVVTYNSSGNDDLLRLMATGVFTMVCKIMAFMAFYYGFRELKLAGKNKTENATVKVIVFWVCGALMYNIIWTYDFFVATIGFDFLRFVF